MKKSIIKFGLVFALIAPAGQAANNASQTYGPVQQNESLYRIALKYRQPGVTVPQLMMSIFESNPEAFAQQNINQLKVGSQLRIPDLDSISAVDRKQALNQATAHNDSYEDQARQSQVQSGVLEPLSSTPRDPDLAPLVDVSQLTFAIAEEVAPEPEIQLAQVQLPEPKVAAQPTTRKVREAPKKPLFNYSYELAYVNDDNVRLAQEDVDIREDSILSAAVKARGGKSLSSHSIWNYGASATYNLFETFDELNNYEVEANTRYRVAFSSGFTSPIYTLGVRISGVEFDSEMRDATNVSLSAELNKWLTTTINMTAGLGHKTSEAKSEAYDTVENRFFLNFDTNLSRTDLIYTTFTYIVGDTVSSATPTVAIINVADSIEPDDAFGGIDANQFAYRIESETTVITVGYNHIFTPDLSFDISARFVDTEAVDDDSIGYERQIIRASLLGRF